MAISPSSSRAHGIPVGTLGAVLGLGVRFSTDWENGGEYECLALHRAFLYILSQGSLQRSGALTFHRNPLLKIFQNFEAFLRLSSATQLFIPKCRYWVAFSFLKSHTLRAGSAGRSWLCLYKEGIPPNFSLLLFFFFLHQSKSRDHEFQTFEVTNSYCSSQGRHCSTRCSLSPILCQCADLALLCDGHQHPHRQSSRRGHVNVHPAQAHHPSQSCQDHPSLA